MQYSFSGGKLPSGSDHRKAVRVEINESVVFRPKNRLNHGGTLRDVSETGLYFFSEADLQPNSELIFYIPLQIGRKKRLCMVSGKILRQELAETLPFGYGVRFENSSSSESNVMLHDFVKFKKTGVLPEKSHPSATFSGHSDPGQIVPPPDPLKQLYEPKKLSKHAGNAKLDKTDLRSHAPLKKRRTTQKSKARTYLLLACLISLGVGLLLGIQKLRASKNLLQAHPALTAHSKADSNPTPKR